MMNIKNAHVKYIISLLLFGLNGIVASLITLSSYEIVLTRTLSGAVFLVLIFITTRQKAHFLENKTHFLYLVISGAALGASWLFLYEAYRQLGVGTASLAYYCGPVIVMILSSILFKEKLTWATALGFAAVLMGMYCVNMKALLDGGSVRGLFYGVMSAVMYAVMIIFTKKAGRITGLENSMWQVVSSFLIVAIFLGLKQGFAFPIGAGNIIPILILGIVNTGIGCYLYFSAVDALPVQTVAICGYLEPLSAVVFSVIFLSEKMSGIQILGAVLILGGAAFGELYNHRKIKTSDRYPLQVTESVIKR